MRRRLLLLLLQIFVLPPVVCLFYRHPVRCQRISSWCKNGPGDALDRLRFVSAVCLRMHPFWRCWSVCVQIATCFAFASVRSPLFVPTPLLAGLRGETSQLCDWGSRPVHTAAGRTECVRGSGGFTVLILEPDPSEAPPGAFNLMIV